MALIGYLASIEGVTLPINATQTAEALHTSVAITQTAEALGKAVAMTQTANVLETSIAIAQTADALKTETSIAMTQTVDVLAVSIAMTSQAILTQSVPTPTEIKPIKYEYTVQSGDTLREISKKYFIVDFYADAIGKANCTQLPIAGNILIIKYYYIQQGDSPDSIAERFRIKVGFLRYINNLSEDVISLPAGYILILPGKCGSS